MHVFMPFFFQFGLPFAYLMPVPGLVAVLAEREAVHYPVDR
jgi:hypothetical protein